MELVLKIDRLSLETDFNIGRDKNITKGTCHIKENQANP